MEFAPPVMTLTSAAAAVVADLGLVLVLITGTEGNGRYGTVGPTLAMPYSNPSAEKGVVNRLVTEKGMERGALGVGMRRRPRFEQRQRRRVMVSSPLVLYSLSYVAYLLVHFRVVRRNKDQLERNKFHWCFLLLCLAHSNSGTWQFFSALRTDTVKGS